MARNFVAASSQQINCSGGQLAGFPWTYGSIAVLFRRSAVSGGAFKTLLSSDVSGAIGFDLAFNTGDNLTYISNGTSATAATTFTSTTNWYLFVLSKATGSAVPRLHYYDYNAALWSHVSLDVAQADGAAGNTSNFHIGAFTTIADWFSGDIAAAGVYRQWEPSDNDVVNSGLHLSRMAWLQASAHADKSWVAFLDQGATADLVHDYLGNGNQTSTSASVPALTTGAVPLLSWGAAQPSAPPGAPVNIINDSAKGYAGVTARITGQKIATSGAARSAHGLTAAATRSAPGSIQVGAGVTASALGKKLTTSGAARSAQGLTATQPGTKTTTSGAARTAQALTATALQNHPLSAAFGLTASAAGTHLTTPPPTSTNRLLLETTGAVLQETTGYVLLEQGDVVGGPPIGATARVTGKKIALTAGGPPFGLTARALQNHLVTGSFGLTATSIRTATRATSIATAIGATVRAAGVRVMVNGFATGVTGATVRVTGKKIGLASFGYLLDESGGQVGTEATDPLLLEGATVEGGPPIGLTARALSAHIGSATVANGASAQATGTKIATTSAARSVIGLTATSTRTHLGAATAVSGATARSTGVKIAANGAMRSSAGVAGTAIKTHPAVSAIGVVARVTGTKLATAATARSVVGLTATALQNHAVRSAFGLTATAIVNWSATAEIGVGGTALGFGVKTITGAAASLANGATVRATGKKIALASINYLLDENGNYLLDENGNPILLEGGTVEGGPPIGLTATVVRVRLGAVTPTMGATARATGTKIATTSAARSVIGLIATTLQNHAASTAVGLAARASGSKIALTTGGPPIGFTARATANRPGLVTTVVGVGGRVAGVKVALGSGRSALGLTGRALANFQASGTAGVTVRATGQKLVGTGSARTVSGVNQLVTGAKLAITATARSAQGLTGTALQNHAATTAVGVSGRVSAAKVFLTGAARGHAGLTATAVENFSAQGAIGFGATAFGRHIFFATSAIGFTARATGAGATKFSAATTAFGLTARVAGSSYTGLIYDNNRSGHYEIYRVDPDGAISQLTANAAYDSFGARLSPNRQSLVFLRTPAGTHDTSYTQASLWKMNVDGSGLTQVLAPNAFGFNAISHPEWAADGNSFILAATLGGNAEIYTLQTNGTGPSTVAITSQTGQKADPSYSPDGATIVYAFAGNIYKVPAGGGVATQLTTDAGLSYSNASPYFSPDGTKIIWLAHTTAAVGADYAIRSMNPDGSGKFSVLADGGNNGRPSWSLSGDRVYLHRSPPGPLEPGPISIYSLTYPDGVLSPLYVSTAGASEYPAFAPPVIATVTKGSSGVSGQATGAKTTTSGSVQVAAGLTAAALQNHAALGSVGVTASAVGHKMGTAAAAGVTATAAGRKLLDRTQQVNAGVSGSAAGAKLVSTAIATGTGLTALAAGIHQAAAAATLPAGFGARATGTKTALGSSRTAQGLTATVLSNAAALVAAGVGATVAGAKFTRTSLTGAAGLTLTAVGVQQHATGSVGTVGVSATAVGKKLTVTSVVANAGGTTRTTGQKLFAGSVAANLGLSARATGIKTLTGGSATTGSGATAQASGVASIIILTTAVNGQMGCTASATGSKTCSGVVRGHGGAVATANCNKLVNTASAYVHVGVAARVSSINLTPAHRRSKARFTSQPTRATFGR